jgi:hypothetical protein
MRWTILAFAIAAVAIATPVRPEGEALVVSLLTQIPPLSFYDNQTNYVVLAIVASSSRL